MSKHNEIAWSSGLDINQKVNLTTKHYFAGPKDTDTHPEVLSGGIITIPHRFIISEIDPHNHTITLRLVTDEGGDK
jgi:hypothetical protein